MKKMLTLLLAAVLLLALASCGGDTAPSGAVESLEPSEPPVSEPAEEETPPSETADVPAKTVSAEELTGTWEILGWTVDSDGSWAPLEAPQYYSFDGTTMEYDTGADVIASAYTVEDGGLNLTDWGLVWPMSLNEEGQLCLGDARYGITYVCEKAAENGGEALTAEDLIGTWEILGWTVDSDGSWAPLEAPQYYSFDGTTMEYDTGADVIASAYTVEDGGLNLTDWGLVWPMSLNEEGQLCLGDARYGITYVCQK